MNKPELPQKPSLARAFDFYPGSWRVRMQQRKVNGKLEVLSEWTAFDATVTVHRWLPNGFVEEYEMRKPEGVSRAVGSRFYDVKLQQWSIYWANDRDGAWQPPSKGGALTADGFELVMPDSYDGHELLSRYKWTTVDANHPMWEQSFSNDDGKTWISNWIMKFTRV
ncbi:MAG: hypothetical protein M3126_10940 [Candidatus Eremiobacteraeota bacterium]|nr:hypothetical protein [Candidatus Eremiobacteraeota bacterium]